MLEKDPHSDMGTERVAMGQWMADYLDDAGYETWYVQPTIYKMLFMNAFPAIDKLDNKKVDYRKLDTADLENQNIKFLKVADEHIKVRRNQLSLKERLGITGIAGKIKF